MTADCFLEQMQQIYTTGLHRIEMESSNRSAHADINNGFKREPRMLPVNIDAINSAG